MEYNFPVAYIAYKQQTKHTLPIVAKYYKSYLIYSALIYKVCDKLNNEFTKTYQSVKRVGK